MKPLGKHAPPNELNWKVIDAELRDITSATAKAFAFDRPAVHESARPFVVYVEGLIELLKKVRANSDAAQMECDAWREAIDANVVYQSDPFNDVPMMSPDAQQRHHAAYRALIAVVPGFDR